MSPSPDLDIRIVKSLGGLPILYSKRLPDLRLELYIFTVWVPICNLEEGEEPRYLAVMAE